jgi:hypothetical protein
MLGNRQRKKGQVEQKKERENCGKRERGRK